MHIPHISLDMMKSQDTLQYVDDNKMHADDPTVEIHEITNHDGVHKQILSETRLAPTASRTSRIIPRWECGLWQLRSDVWPIHLTYILCLQRRELKRFQNEPTIERPKQPKCIVIILGC